MWSVANDPLEPLEHYTEFSSQTEKTFLIASSIWNDMHPNAVQTQQPSRSKVLVRKSSRVRTELGLWFVDLKVNGVDENV
jgi:hypothetical protein